MATRSSVTICADQTDGEVTQAKCTTQRKRHQLRGGFECVFVKDPSEHPEHGVQTECSICLCVLREPYLLDCCGYSFCKSCIEPVKSEKKPCPLCAVQFTTCIADKRLKRTLNDLQVYCAHKEEGCEWVGRLVNLEQHLNVNPLHEGERLSGCQVTSLKCKHRCGECFQRRELLNHETSVCSQRPYSCEYCREFNSTFKNVTSNHLSVCPDRPVPCPNDCGSSPALKLLDNHLKECPLEVIECAFSYAGCIEKLPRKDMPEHITQRLAIHMSLQATSHQQEQQKLHHQISELKALHQQEVVKLNLRITELQELCEQSRAELKMVNQKAQDERLIHVGNLSVLRGEMKKTISETKQEVSKQMKSDVAAVHSHVGLVPFSITMPGFQQKKMLVIPWYSPSFYTHPRGYKMCLRVDANGYGDGKKSHVSVFVCMMKGEYDKWLKWPFRGHVTIQLLNQVGDGEHHVYILDVADDADFGDRVLDGKQHDGGWGFHEYIRHKNLTPHYLKDDCLKLCIKYVIIKS